MADLDLLPPAPSNKMGWPWHGQLQLPSGAELSDYPKITVITPSYNQGEFIEETIRSVLMQNYPSLEFLIIDGGSTDRTLEIIEKYSPFITYWESESDKGQSHAINKGLQRATGEIFAWLNSDDIYCPGALSAVGRAYAANRGAVVAGDVIHFEGRKEWVKDQSGLINGLHTFWKADCQFQQPGIFLPLSLIENIGRLDEHLYFGMDLDLLCRVWQRQPKVVLLGSPLAKFRWHANSKSSRAQNIWLMEQDIVWRRYAGIFSGSAREHDSAMAELILVRSVGNARAAEWSELFQHMVAACRLRLLVPVLSLGVTHSWRRAAASLMRLFFGLKQRLWSVLFKPRTRD